MFKKDGRNSGLALVLISLTQAFLFELVLNPIVKYFFDKNDITHYAKQLGYAAIFIFFVFFYFNYRKYNGKFNHYKYYWKDEKPLVNFIKGILVFLSLLLPIILFGLINTHWYR